MANIIDQITVGDQHLLVIDADPTLSPGLAVPVGSIAMYNNSGVGQLYFNPTGAALGWIQFSDTLETVANVATANNTATSIMTVGTTSNSTTLLKVDVTAVRTGGTSGNAGDGLASSFELRVKNIAGTASVNTLQTAYKSAEGGYNVTFTASGASIIINVQGPSNTNVDWKAGVKFQVVI